MGRDLSKETYCEMCDLQNQLMCTSLKGGHGSDRLLFRARMRGRSGRFLYYVEKTWGFGNTHVREKFVICALSFPPTAVSFVVQSALQGAAAAASFATFGPRRKIAANTDVSDTRPQLKARHAENSDQRPRPTKNHNNNKGGVRKVL